MTLLVDTPVATPRGVDAVRARWERIVVWPGRAAVGTVIGLTLLWPSIPLAIQIMPLMASLLVSGLPHGAVDHLAWPWALNRPAGPRAVAGVVVVYLGLMSLYLLVWLAAPSLGFILFIALTLYHWGQGDLHWLVTFEGAGFLRTNAARARALLVRGSLPMLIPLLVAPAMYRTVADSTIGVAGTTGIDWPAWADSGWWRAVAGAVLTGLVIGSLTRDLAACQPGNRAVWRWYAADTALLAVMFVVAPPLPAIGVYFCGWHAPRHIARMALLNPATESERGQVGAALWRFARSAALPTAAALVLLVGLGALAPRPPTGWLGLVGVYLIGLSLLTLPHAVIVTWLDMRQEIWLQTENADRRHAGHC